MSLDVNVSLTKNIQQAYNYGGDIVFVTKVCSCNSYILKGIP
jgi:hypothetical protein